MDIDKALIDLNRRFSAPLSEYYNRRIIFWNDEDAEFQDKIDDIAIPNVKVIKLTGSNTFVVKRLLSIEDTTSNYLVYNPLKLDSLEDDWLLDIKLYSEEFRSDLISIWMNELNIGSSLEVRNKIKAYRKFFNAKERRQKIKNQADIPQTASQVHLAVMAAICGETNARPEKILKAVLKAGLNKETNPIYTELVNYDAQEAFWQMVKSGTGYDSENRDLLELCANILLTAAARTLSKDVLKGLERFISNPHSAFCYSFVSDWLRREDVNKLKEIARDVEDELKLFDRFNRSKVEDIADTECFPCINEIILSKVMTDIINSTVNYKDILEIVEKRRTCAFYKRFSVFYDGILQVANMYKFYNKHQEGFHCAVASEIWKNYENDYYKMDYYYRRFHLAFQKSLDKSNYVLDDLFKQVVDKVENLYSNWYLSELSENWTAVSAEELQTTGRISGIKQQEDFYENKVINTDSRIYVIISDAMRYEVAATLSEDLRRENQSDVSLESMQGIFPTVTKFGMAALLPHRELSAEIKNDSVCVLADNESTASNNREKVLKYKNPSSVVLQYKNIIGMKRAERTPLVKGEDVVYIYHDTIDEASHHSDTAVFPACEKAITEIKNIIRIIVNDFGGTNIAITSDHGFLYTYSPLKEDNKLDKTSFNNKVVEYGRRYAIVEKNGQPEYLLPVKLLNGNTDLKGFAPRDNVRLKMSGGGLNFVHGGISLQEMVVPVIEYHHLRNDYAQYKNNRQKYDTKPVEINLLSSSRKISNMIFGLDFYQKDAVSANRESAVYQVYFEDSNGKKISDVQKIIADKKSQDTLKRTFHCNFNLKQQDYKNSEIYYLVIADGDGIRMPQREEFRIDIAFSLGEFDFGI